MSDLLTRLIADGTSPELIAEVAMLLAERKVLDERRANDRRRKQEQREREKEERSHVTSRDVTGQDVTSQDSPSLSLLPNENKSNPSTHTHPEGESPPTRKAAPASDDCAIVVSAWNDMARAAGLRTCAKLSDTRRRRCRARLKDDGLQAIQRAIQQVPRSAFLRGDAGDWAGANIDFLLRPDTVTKILEGQYDDRPASAPQRGPAAWRAASGRPEPDHRDGFQRALDERIFGAAS